MAVSNKFDVDLLRDNPQLFKWVVLSGDTAFEVADAVLHYLKLDAAYMLTSGQSVIVRVCEDGSIYHDVRGWNVPLEYWGDNLELQFNVGKIFLQHRIYMTSLDSHSVVSGEFLTETEVIDLEAKYDEVRSHLADAIRTKAIALANRHLKPKLDQLFHGNRVFSLVFLTGDSTNHLATHPACEIVHNISQGDTPRPVFNAGADMGSPAVKLVRPITGGTTYGQFGD